MTLTWVRFAVAAVLTLGWVAARGQLRRYRSLTLGDWGWLGLAAAGLVGNYVLFLFGLARTTPGSSQVLIQLAPLLLGLGGVVFFGERLSRVQLLGVGVLLLGWGVFSGEQLLAMVATASTYAVGIGLIALAAASWAVYALVQKRLARVLGPQAILLGVYAAGALALLPVARPATLLALDTDQALAVGYACLNTVGAYGAFAAAVSVWDSSRVGAVITLTPIGTLVLVQLAAAAGLPWVEPEAVGLWGVLGAVGVVAGSMTVSLGARRAREG